MDECKVRAPGSLEWEGQQPMTEREKHHLLRCAIAFVEIKELENVGGESRASLAHKLQVMLVDAPDDAAATPAEVSLDEVKRISDMPQVLDAFMNFAENVNGGNGEEIVRAILGVIKAAPTPARGIMPDQEAIVALAMAGKFSEEKTREIILKAFPHLAAPQVSGDWKLVPAEPTEEMCLAAEKCKYGSSREVWIDGAAYTPENVEGLYKTMLSAAPTPPEVEPVGKVHANEVSYSVELFEAYENLPDGTKLYTRPKADELMAAAEEAVHEWFGGKDIIDMNVPMNKLQSALGKKEGE